MARGVATSALTQGVEVVTGLQDKFDWAGVAAAGIGGGVSAEIGPRIGAVSIAEDNSVNNYALNGVADMASGIANAATRSIIQGTDFGDNLLAALPNVLGQTVGNALAFGISAPPQDAEAAPPAKVSKAAAASGSAAGQTKTIKVGGLTVTVKGGNGQDVAAVLKTLPAAALKVLAAAGVQVVVVQDSMVDYDPSLKGKTATGHGTQTWDTIPGQYDPQTKTVVIATSGKYSHGAYDLVLHEIGHALDAALHYASTSKGFKQAYSKTAGTYNMADPREAYFTQLGNPAAYLSESFAESFAGYFGSNVPNGWINSGVTTLNTPARSAFNNYWKSFQWPK